MRASGCRSIASLTVRLARASDQAPTMEV
uniref:Uncharacterized protein n=1 Tax=Arundo donax TaxID=35708 RepID=A0A0A9C1Q4_ARUDO